MVKVMRILKWRHEGFEKPHHAIIHIDAVQVDRDTNAREMVAAYGGETSVMMKGK